MGFADLKQKAMNMDALVNAADTNKKKESYGDDRKWKPTVDKAGNGYAVIRFLPAVEGDDLPWAKYFDHFFQGPTGQWYVEKSLTTIGKDDPVSQLNSKLWNNGTEDGKQQARKQKRRLHYVTNIMVVSDPENPENNGKVFLYEFGAKIFDKIMDAMQPQYQDETPMNPFDMWKGANFKIKIAQVAGYRNYDRSEFGAAEQLADDAKLEDIYNSEYSLKEFTDPSTYKSYDELNLKMTRVLGEGGAVTTSAEQVDLDETVASPFETPTPVAQATTSNDDGGDTMSYFAKLAAEA